VTRGTRQKNLLLLAASPAKPAELGDLGDLGFARPCGRNNPSAEGERGVQREGEGKETSSARTGLCPRGCIIASART
jgi:hypothetical protein